MDDAIVNGTLHVPPGAPAPLALFRAARIDYSMHRLLHYTGTDPEHFQNFMVFTNYQFYADAFARLCRERMAKGDPELRGFCRARKRHYAQCAARWHRSDGCRAGALTSDASPSSRRAETVAASP